MSLDGADQKIIDNVREYGWHAVHVPEDDEGPGFSFSVGLWEGLGAPELIVFGLPNELMHHMLWATYRQIQSGRKLQDGSRWSDLIEGFDCISRPVHESRIREYFGAAIWYRRYRAGSADLRAYQMFWPGKIQGLYPWQPGCDESVRDYQPLLYLPSVTGLA